MIKNTKIKNRIKRHESVRKSVFGTETRPRLCVFRTNAHIYAQIINDVDGLTIVATSDIKSKKGTKVESAKRVGEEIAKLALKKDIKTVVFDRGGFKYHGRVKALADGAREGGLQF